MMIEIKDKKDSIAKIKQMGINSIPVDVFSVDNKESIKRFFENNPASEYIMRSTIKAQGLFFFVKDYEEAEQYLDKYQQEVTIAVSVRPYKEDIVLLGDVIVKRSGMSEMVDITARDDIDATHRNIYEKPKYNFHASLEDDRLWKIPGFSKLMRYISDHELYDVILEFVVYDCKVGTYKENVVIIEMRTGY